MNRTMLFARCPGPCPGHLLGRCPGGRERARKSTASARDVIPWSRARKKAGPSLHGVVGHVPGTADGDNFSKAMKAYGESGIVWNEEALDAFLESPRKAVKGTKMGFSGLERLNSAPT